MARLGSRAACAAIVGRSGRNGRADARRRRRASAPPTARGAARRMPDPRYEGVVAVARCGRRGRHVAAQAALCRCGRLRGSQRRGAPARRVQGSVAPSSAGRGPLADRRAIGSGLLGSGWLRGAERAHRRNREAAARRRLPGPSRRRRQAKAHAFAIRRRGLLSEARRQ